MNFKLCNSCLSNSLEVKLVLLLLLCICYLTLNADAGKGKGVPIYMPIPIPVPMPVGPATGGKISQHHSGGDGDGDGEVRKIYLLQPMPRAQPQLKGGGGGSGYIGGPVQTHIHMPAPIVQQQQQHHHQQVSKTRQNQFKSSSDYSMGEGDAEQAPEQLKSPGRLAKASQSSHNHFHSDMKILPIVVIPPIAPIPPIHLSSADQQQKSGDRMSLSPQFNNYLVTQAANEMQQTRKRQRSNPHDISQVTMLHDQRHFSDYNLASSPSRMDSVQRRARAQRRARHEQQVRARLRRPANGFGELELEDDYNDYDSAAPYLASSTQLRPSRDEHEFSIRARISPANRRRQTRRLSGGRSPPPLDLIRDILAESQLQSQQQQQHNSIFDDEPNALADEQYQAARRNRATGDQLADTYHLAARQQRRQMTPNSMADILAADSISSEREREPPAEASSGGAELASSWTQAANEQRSLAAGSARIQRPFALDLAGNRLLDELLELGPAGASSSRKSLAKELSSVYYDRELQSASPLEQAERQSIRGNSSPRSIANGSSALRHHLEDRDYANSFADTNAEADDEWRFDSIKSVAHTSPTISGNTQANNHSTTINREHTNSTITGNQNSTQISLANHSASNAKEN